MPFTFLFPAMLATLAAAAAPIIIHLLNKRRHRIVRWGATMFLRNSLSRVQRRLQLRHIILLIIRTSLLLLLSLALARPLIKPEGGAAAALGSAKTDLILLLDNSLSMAWTNPAASGKQSNFDLAKSAANDLIDTLHAGDSVTAWLVSDRAAPLLPEPTFDLDRARKVIQAAPISSGGSNLLKGLDAAIQSLRKLRNPNREIYILTDARSSGWSLERDAEWTIIKEPLEQMRPRPIVRVINVAPIVEENLSVVSLSTFPQLVSLGQAVRADARISNSADAPKTIVATLTVDSSPKNSTTVTIPAGQTSTVSFYHSFDTHGAHSLDVSIGEDALNGDNRRHYALEVLQKFPVLLVNGSPSAEPLKGATDFLAFAFSANLSSASASLVEPTIIDYRSLAEQDFSKFSAIALVDVPRLTADQITRLETFVRDGGGALIALGAAADRDFYNNDFFREGQSLGVGQLTNTPTFSRSDVSANFIAINPPPYSHPALENFNDPTRGDLSRVHIFRYHDLEPDAANQAVRVVAKLSNESPWLIEKKFGNGRALWLTTPLNVEWSDLPARPLFVPLAHELMFYLGSGRVASRNFAVGETLTASLPAADTSATLGAGYRSVTATLQIPAGEVKPLDFARTGNAWTTAFTKTDTAGIYRAEVRGDGGATRGLVFAVNPPAIESDLTPLSDKHRQILADRTGMTFVSVSDRGKDLRGERRGIELWRTLAKIILALLVLETFLAARWSRRGEMPADPDDKSAILGGKIVKKKTEQKPAEEALTR